MRKFTLIFPLLLLAVACSSAVASNPTQTSSPTATPDVRPTATPITADTFESSSPTPARVATPQQSEDPFLTVLRPYPEDGAIGVTPHTTIQFELYREMPVVQVSISPDIQIERLQFKQNERSVKVASWTDLREGNYDPWQGYYYLYRPTSDLEPGTTYEVSVELGRVDHQGRQNTVVRTWQFTTSEITGADLSETVGLPRLISEGEGGHATGMFGELIVEDGCIYVGSNSWVPIFEDGTVWWEGGALFLRGNRFKIGETVFLGGSASEYRPDLNYAEPPAEECMVNGVFHNVQ